LFCFNILEDSVAEDNNQIKLTTFRKEELMMEKCETEMKEKQLNDDDEEKKSIIEKDADSTAVVQKSSEPIIKTKPYPHSMNSQKGRLNYFYTYRCSIGIYMHWIMYSVMHFKVATDYQIINMTPWDQQVFRLVILSRN